jgi:hypothetical protein
MQTLPPCQVVIVKVWPTSAYTDKLSHAQDPFNVSKGWRCAARVVIFIRITEGRDIREEGCYRGGIKEGRDRERKT